MKSKILHWTSALLASTAMLLTACTADDETSDDNTSANTPVFPDLEELTIQAGETTCDVSFTPNMNWTVSIPTDAETSRWFELRDGEIKGSSFSGVASTSPVTITVATIEQDAFDEAPVCEVSLTMGGQTQVIARVTRANTVRTFALFASEYDVTEEDDFTIPYVYSDTELTKYTGSETDIAYADAPEGTVELKWPTRVGNYMYVFKSKSNFSWLASTPSWVEISSTAITDEEDTSGAYTYYQITVNGKFSEETIDGAVGVIDFYDASLDESEDPGNNAHNRYCISMPAFRDLIRHPYSSSTPNISFEANGSYVNSNGTESESYSSSVYSTEGIGFYALELKNGWYFEADWLTIEDSWDASGAIFQSHTYTIKAAANSTDASRTATLLALPASLAQKISDPAFDLCTTEGDEILAEYQPYIFATVEQKSENAESEGGFSLSYEENFMNNYYVESGYFKLEDLTNGDPETDEDVANNWDVIEGGGKLYRLTYPLFDMMGSISFLLNGEYANVVASSTGNWLGAEVYDNEMYVTMEAPESTYTGGQGFIRIYDSSYNQLACIICIRNF